MARSGSAARSYWPSTHAKSSTCATAGPSPPASAWPYPQCSPALASFTSLNLYFASIDALTCSLKNSSVGWLSVSSAAGNPTDQYDAGFILGQQGAGNATSYLVRWRAAPEYRSITCHVCLHRPVSPFACNVECSLILVHPLFYCLPHNSSTFCFPFRLRSACSSSTS